MKQIELRTLPADFLPIVQRAANGETIVICDDQQPIVEMRPMAPNAAGERPIGLAAGKIEVLPRFFEPLPDEFARAFGIWKDRTDLSTDSAKAAAELRQKDRCENQNDDSR
jgi:antitoxin (DNA-binding transcriptional repressor) of toxin-antitoxin stability system